MKTQTWYVGIMVNDDIIGKKSFDNYDECYEYYAKLLFDFEWFGFYTSPMFWCEIA